MGMQITDEACFGQGVPYPDGAFLDSIPFQREERHHGSSLFSDPSVYNSSKIIISHTTERY